MAKVYSTHGTLEITHIDPEGNEIVGGIVLTGLRKKYDASAAWVDFEALGKALIEGCFNRVQDRIGRKGIMEHEIQSIADDALARICDGTYGGRGGSGDPVLALAKQICLTRVRAKYPNEARSEWAARVTEVFADPEKAAPFIAKAEAELEDDDLEV